MDLDELFRSILGEGSDDGDSAAMEELDRLLTEAEIPHEYYLRPFGGGQIVYYGHAGKPKPGPNTIYQGSGIGAVCSAVQFTGGINGIEIMGLLTEEERKYDSVKDGLTAQDVFERIKKHWTEEQ